MFAVKIFLDINSPDFCTYHHNELILLTVSLLNVVICMNLFFFHMFCLLCRTRKCIIIALIVLFILLYLWPSRLMFSRSSGQQFLMPHKWLSATSHPLGLKCNIDYSLIQNVTVCMEC